MDDMFKKNMEVWEKMTNTYMDGMFKTVEKTMEQSQVFQKQVDKAVATAMNTQLDATLATLKTLQRQVEALSAKVDQLLAEKKQVP